MERVIIVGGGLAGLRTAEALRAQGHVGGLTLVAAEPHPPYDRPPLSKAVLRGETEDTTVAADWEALGCELLLGRRATGLGEDLETTEGPLGFDGLVIATGASPIRLPGEGPQHVLRSIEDARTLRAGLRPGARLVIVGAGWIGAEVATAAAAAGCRVPSSRRPTRRSPAPSAPRSARGPPPGTPRRGSSCATGSRSPPSDPAGSNSPVAARSRPTWC
jgi:3-phenylpropionate/trans-cinnamate dioxygenase ferredoxin reductase component